MKKKLLSLMLALALACALVVPAFAAPASMSNFAPSIKYTTSTFKDVPAGSWYAQSVQLCYEYGLMTGKGAGKFDPAGTMTLAEAVVMADHVHEIYTTGANTAKTGTPWYKPYVDYAVANGIVQAGEFADYTAKATRAQMAHIFAKALPAEQLAAINEITAVPDVKTTDKYGAEIYQLYNAGILSGNDKYGTFAPNSNISRNAAASIISRVALPTQRCGVVLFKDFSKDIVRFVMPTDTQYSNSNGMDMYISYNVQAAGANTAIGTVVDSSLSGYTIQDAMTKEEMQGLLVDEFSQTGVNASIIGSSTVKFGAIPAYRYDITVDGDGISAKEYVYCFINGAALYTVAISSCNPTVLKTMDSSLTVNGFAAK